MMRSYIGTMLRSLSKLALPARGSQYGCNNGQMELDDHLTTSRNRSTKKKLINWGPKLALTNAVTYDTTP